MDERLLLGMVKERANFYQLDDPWDLPSCFLLRKNKYWKSPRTYSGYWKEKEEEHTAIRSAAESSAASASPAYVGVRKTLEFYLNDGTNGGKGTKTDWACHEYHHLRKDDAGDALFLQEDMVLRKVFNRANNETDQASCLHRQIESCVKAYKEACVKDYKEAYSRRDGNKSDIMLQTEESEFLSMDTLATINSILNQAMIDPRLFFEMLSLEVSLLGLPGSDRLVSEFRKKRESTRAECDSHGNSDEVWKHFTKIRGANDPDEVYAACHHCDKVLKVHPNKDGTFLTSHFDTCSRCTKSNPSTDEDRKMLRLLRTVIDNPHEQQKMDEKLNCQEDLTQLDPWELLRNHGTPCYVTRPSNWQTQRGRWEEIDKEFIAIRTEDHSQVQGSWEDTDKVITMIQIDPQFQMQVPQPQYMGTRRTLQFLDQDGTELDFIMLEYQQLDDVESPALFLQGNMVIRKVFYYDKDAVVSGFIDFNTWLNSDDDNEEYKGTNMDSTLPSDYMNGGGDRKRKRSASSKRTSEVWIYFTEIHTADPKVVYAVCHSCDRGYGTGCSKNGTNHLWRHKRSCTSKLPGTGNLNNGVNAAWEAEVWPLFQLLKNYGETEH